MFDSFANFFTTVQLVVIVGAASFITGVFSSQKVKDWLAGVPSDLRSALKSVEGDALGRIKAAQVAVLNDIAGRIHGDAPVVAKAPLAASVAKAPLAAAPDVVKTPLAASLPAPAPLVPVSAAPAPVIAVASPAVAAAAQAAVDDTKTTVLPTRAPVLPSEGAPVTPPVV